MAGTNKNPLHYIVHIQPINSEGDAGWYTYLYMNQRVLGAVMIGVALVAAAFVVSRFGAAPQPQAVIQNTDPSVSVVAASAPQKQYIPTEDSNGDGIPDWQELLIQSDTIELAETVTYEEPETLTDQFAVEFFEGYVRNKGFGEFSNDPETIVQTASADLVAQARDALYSESDITMTVSSPEAIRAHANAIATIIAESALPAGTPNEVDLMEQVIATNNFELLVALDPIITNYDGMITKMIATPVPTQAVKEHLDVLNAFQAVHNDIVAFQEMNVDPLYSLLRLQRYQDDVQGMVVAISNLFNQARAIGAPLQSTDPVFSVFTFE